MIEKRNDTAVDNSGVASMHSIAQPQPNETLGEYFDRLTSKNDTDLSKRQLRRTASLTEVVWSEDEMNFNISMSRCISLSDVAGTYTSKHGVQPSATIHDIIEDLQTRGGSEGANRIAYASRVEENAQQAIEAAKTYLDSVRAGDTSLTPDPHNELRHLLGRYAQFVAILARTTIIYEIMIGFSMGMTELNGNLSTPQSVPVALVISGFFFAQQCQVLAQRPQGVSFITGTVLNTFLAVVRDLVYKVSHEHVYDLGPSTLNRTEATMMSRAGWPISPRIAQNAMERMQDTAMPTLRIGSQEQLATGTICPSV